MKTIHVLLTSFSDPVAHSLEFAHTFKTEMHDRGIKVDFARLEESWISFEEKAQIFNQAVTGGKYDWIVDISGGNLANGMLPWIDFESYSQSSVCFIGFSDLSSFINALACKSEKPVFLLPMYYQNRMDAVAQFLHSKNGPLLDWQVDSCCDGFQLYPLKGGNLRCFLKLAGTEYFPDLHGYTLFLEGMGTSVYELMSLLAQLSQIGAFDQAENVVFGCFSRIYRENGYQSPLDALRFFQWVLSELHIEIPFGVTFQVGHIPDSAGLWIAGHPVSKQS